jgi:hypothetical protein
MVVCHYKILIFRLNVFNLKPTSLVFFTLGERLPLNQKMTMANETRQSAAPSSGARRSRAGKHLISGFFDENVVKALKQLALDLDTTVQIVLASALNDKFERHGIKRLADESAPLRGGAAHERVRQKSERR